MVVDSRTKAQTDRNDNANNMGQRKRLKSDGKGAKHGERWELKKIKI